MIKIYIFTRETIQRNENHVNNIPYNTISNDFLIFSLFFYWNTPGWILDTNFGGGATMDTSALRQLQSDS